MTEEAQKILVVEDLPMKLGKHERDLVNRVLGRAISKHEELSRLSRVFNSYANSEDSNKDIQDARGWSDEYKSRCSARMRKYIGGDGVEGGVVTEDYLAVAPEMLRNELSEEYHRNVDVDLTIDAKSALGKLSREKYDLVISDMGLPYIGKITADFANLYQEGMISRGSSDEEKIAQRISGLERLINQASFNSVLEILNKEDVKFPNCSTEELLEYVLRIPNLGGGNLVVNEAKEKGMPVYIFTNAGHFIHGLAAGLIGGSITPEQAKNIINNISTLWSYRSTISSGNLFVGNKDQLGVFPSVIDSVIRKEEYRKLAEKK